MTDTPKPTFRDRITSGCTLILAEASPPRSADPDAARALAASFSGLVHALGISDGREGVRMSAVATAALAISENIEPILHVTTRDRNRTALFADLLGAHALGVRNVLCTSGTHQALGPCAAARNVFDLDSIQLLKAFSESGRDGSLVGEAGFPGIEDLCLGATAAPQADPLEFQVMRLAKKVTAGAAFIVTQPVYDLERFQAWWHEVRRAGLHERTAIIAGIDAPVTAAAARALAASRPNPGFPAAALERFEAADTPAQQRRIGIELALETLRSLSEIKGLRGFCFRGEPAPDIIRESELTV
ncbi:MAG: methylenetetrahydrofolate reductase [Kiritimatiellaeota bacterium]|nr:methylenetetrahydrofolate reductase [Kiritimatiellota bacterium]